MRLRTTVGAYAGHVRDYSVVAGLAALRSGTAVAITTIVPPLPTPVAEMTAAPVPSRRRPTPRPAVGTTAASR